MLTAFLLQVALVLPVVVLVVAVLPVVVAEVVVRLVAVVVPGAEVRRRVSKVVPRSSL